MLKTFRIHIRNQIGGKRCMLQVHACGIKVAPGRGSVDLLDERGTVCACVDVEHLVRMVTEKTTGKIVFRHREE